MRALRALLDIVSLVGIALVTNDLWDMAPRAATWLAEWSARCRYGATERGAIRAEEFANIVERTPGSVLKLARAMSFVAWAVATRAWASARRVATRPQAITAPEVIPDPVLVGADSASEAGVDTPAEAGADELPRDLRPRPDRTGRLARSLGTLGTGIGAVAGVVGFLGGIVVLAAASGPDVWLVYERGDEPASPPITCFRFACNQDIYDAWQLTAGPPVTTTYGTAGRHRVDTLSGRLTVTSSCDDATVSWRLTVDGTALADGTLASGSDTDLTHVAVPSGHTPAALVLTADLRGGSDCTAQLTWYHPGFESPGLLPAFV